MRCSCAPANESADLQIIARASALADMWIGFYFFKVAGRIACMDTQYPGAATGPDMSRQAATDNDTDFTLSLEEAALLYERAGHPRTLRSLQRYCASGHLDARKIATILGDKYLVTPKSVARHIAQVVELSQLDLVATGINGLHVSLDRTTGSDRSRHT